MENPNYKKKSAATENSRTSSSSSLSPTNAKNSRDGAYLS
jgi:hypothetical protein